MSAIQKEFAKFVLRLESSMDVPSKSQIIRSIHAALGIGGEAGEIQDIIKKHWVYGKPIDRVHLIEECGDLFHYFTMLLNVHGLTLDEIRDANIRKLKTRYPTGYTADCALNRNPSAERQALENQNE